MRFFVRFGVWIIVLAPPIVWELLAFAVRRGSITHPTISQMVKESERHRPYVRVVWAVVLLVLFGHLVWPTF